MSVTLGKPLTRKEIKEMSGFNLTQAYAFLAIYCMGKGVTARVRREQVMILEELCIRTGESTLAIKEFLENSAWGF